ncbi:MAG: ECF transporter S component [Lachnospiraceae bacterium]|nr:ECF transporter S component [Lachnospiraceae bacterium]
MNELVTAVKEHSTYVLGFAAIVAAIFLLAYFLEQAARKKNGTKEKVFSTRKLVMIGMFSAVAVVLMLLEFPLPFLPAFYKLDFSELPVLVCGFAFGPASAVMTEFIKILVKLLIKGTSSAFVGELANFVVGCSMALPAAAIYSFKKTKKGALVSLICGVVIMTVFGSFFNAVYLLPAFAALYGGMPVSALVAMGAEVNPLVKEGSIVSFVIFCTAPLNIIKGGLDAIVTMLIYKPLSPILKGTK